MTEGPAKSSSQPASSPQQQSSSKEGRSRRGKRSKKKSTTPGRSRSTLPQLSGWVAVGKIKAAHGLRGLVRVVSFSDFPERFTEPGPRWLWRPGEEKPTEVNLVRGTFQPGKKLYLVEFETITDRNASEASLGALLMVPEGDRPQLEEDEFHFGDLIGLSVYLQENGEYLGKVTAILPAGNDLLEVTDGKKQVLIPFVKVFVPVVDVAGDRIEVTPPTGLLDT